jgi:hypothetical protein
VPDATRTSAPADETPGPFYHDFRRLGLRNTQFPGLFRANQRTKEPVITAYLLLAIARLRNRGVDRITFAELFCADAYYTMFARAFGADAATGFDSNKRGYLDQARQVRTLLDLDVELVCCDVHDVPETRQFSIVANVGGLYHVDDPVEVLAQSARMATDFLIVQNVVSLARTEDDYFERPAPGWTWGNRYSRRSFDALVRRLGLRIVEQDFNVLEGHELPEHRGSAYYLIDVTTQA